MKNNFVVNNFEKQYNMPDPACVYKWGWSTIFLQSGTTASCHRTDPDFITAENFENFHNTPAKLKASFELYWKNFEDWFRRRWLGLEAA